MQPDATQVAGLFEIPDALLFPAGVALVVLGTYLRFKLNDQAMHAEEQVKDGWLSEEQARRRIVLLRYSGPLMILLGMTACMAVLWS